MTSNSGEPLCARLLEAAHDFEAIEQGWTVSRVSELDLYLDVVDCEVLGSIRSVPLLSAWIHSPLRQLHELLMQDSSMLETSKADASIRFWAKKLKCGLLAAFLKCKYNDFLGTERILPALWDIDSISTIDERCLLTRNTFLHFPVNRRTSVRSWSCPSRKMTQVAKQVPGEVGTLELPIDTSTVSAASKHEQLPLQQQLGRSRRRRWADVVDDEDDDALSGDNDFELKDVRDQDNDGLEQGAEVEAPCTAVPTTRTTISSSNLSKLSKLSNFWSSNNERQDPFQEVGASAEVRGPHQNLHQPPGHWESTSTIPRHSSTPTGRESLSPPEPTPKPKPNVAKPLPSSPGTTLHQPRKHAVATSGDGRWWLELQDICPITNFPVGRLPYPPFRLYKRRPADGQRKKRMDSDIFVDGLVVVLQVIETLDFSVLGKELSLGEIRALDYHMKHCKLGPFRLEEVLRLQEASQTCQEMKRKLEDLQTAASRRLLQVLSLQSRRKKRENLLSQPPCLRD